MGGLLSSYWWGYAGDDEVDPVNYLTGKKKRLVTETWVIVRQESMKVGIAIMMNFFAKHPDYQRQFNAFKDVPLKDLPENKRFQAHCTAIVNAIGATIDSLKDPGLMEATLCTLGEKHQKRGQTIEQFQNLKLVLLATLQEYLGSRWTQDVDDAWNSILDTAYSIIFRAF